eukprot:6797532-Pyramimonas_sp.AAC.1
MRIFTVNDVSDGASCNIKGLSGTKKDNAEPQMLIALLGLFFETTNRERSMRRCIVPRRERSRYVMLVGIIGVGSRKM